MIQNLPIFHVLIQIIDLESLRRELAVDVSRERFFFVIAARRARASSCGFVADSRTLALSVTTYALRMKRRVVVIAAGAVAALLLLLLVLSQLARARGYPRFERALRDVPVSSPLLAAVFQARNLWKPDLAPRGCREAGSALQRGYPHLQRQLTGVVNRDDKQTAD